MPFWLFVILAILILILASGGYTFYAACVRRKELPWDDKEALKQTAYGKHYDNIVLGDAFIKKHDSQMLEMVSHDGLKLSAVWIPAVNPIGTILLAHGYRSNKLVDFSLAFDFYNNRGMNILLPDQRAHGKSEGKYITFGVKESRDIADWIDFHNSHFGEFPLFLSGLSMGASTVLFLADAELPSNVRGIIADCGFTSPKEILQRVFRAVTHLPPIPCVWVTEWFARVFAGFSLSEKDTRQALRNSRLPVVMIHGAEDGFVPCEMSKQGYAACTSPKELFVVDKADHGVSFLVENERYTQLVTNFIDKYI